MIFSSGSIVFRRFPALHDSALFQKETRTRHRVARRGSCMATRSSFVARSKASRLSRDSKQSREIGADPRNRANRREVLSVHREVEGVMSRDEADLSRGRTSSRVTRNAPPERNSQGLAEHLLLVYRSWKFDRSRCDSPRA